jgi:hypothetical protein
MLLQEAEVFILIFKVGSVDESAGGNQHVG